jgi:hypothetical protein
MNPFGLLAPPAEERRGPCLWPLTLVLIILLWIIATTGGRQVFVKEWLSEAFDSQAEYFLRGDPGVDMNAIGPEGMIVKERVRMYFGPFPAFLRMPLHVIYPAGRGGWPRISGFCAGVIALLAFAGLIRDALRSSRFGPGVRNWIGNTCLIGFVFATPLVFLVGNTSIYNEAIVWGLAWSLAALYFACRCQKVEDSALKRSLLAFSFCSAFALLSRLTFALPLVLIAPLLALPLLRKDRIRELAALCLPLGAALLFHLQLSYAKFGSFLGTSYEHYINPVHRDWAQKYGLFRLSRVPLSFVDYFSFQHPAFQMTVPFVTARRHDYSYPTYFTLPFSETFIPIPWASGWLVLGAVFGIIYLFWPNRSDWFQRWIAAALFAQCLFIMMFHALAQRYATEFYPFLIFCLLVFLRNAGTVVHRLRFVVVGLTVVLVAVSSVVNTLAVASWLGMDGQLPETRAFWDTIAGKRPPAPSPAKK